MRSCYCENCGHTDNAQCEFNECDCCGEDMGYEHDSEYEEPEE